MSWALTSLTEKGREIRKTTSEISLKEFIFQCDSMKMEDTQ